MGGAWRAIALALAGVLGGTAAVAEEAAASDPAPPPAAQSTAAPVELSPESLLAQGVEFRKRREDRLALAAFEQAWTLGGSPQALAQIALAEQALGYWREAHEHLEAAFTHADDPWISAHRATLEVALKEITSRLGAVEVSCNVEGAEVRIDGRLVGRTPFAEPIRVAAGKSVIHVVADGYFDAMRQTQIDAEGLARVDFTLTPMTPAEDASGRSAQPRPIAERLVAMPQLERVRAPDTMTNHARTEGTSARDVLTYTSVGLAALGATVGVTGYVIREVNVRLYNDNERCDNVSGSNRSSECRSEFSAWRRGEVMAIAGSAAAGVFGLTALYLWLSQPDQSEESASLSCGIGGRSVTCSTAF